MSLKIAFILANSEDPDEMLPYANSEDLDEMPPYAAFHLGLHCLPKYMFTSIQNEKGYTKNVFLQYSISIYLKIPLIPIAVRMVRLYCSRFGHS